MLKICFNTGSAWVNCFEVEGSLYDDLLRIVEELVENNIEDFAKYQYDELLEDFTEEEIDELYLPINGGEFYIDSIAYVEEV